MSRVPSFTGILMKRYIWGQEQKVLHLCRAIYGLKQAALAWWKELLASMRKIGFEPPNPMLGSSFTKPLMEISLSQ